MPQFAILYLSSVGQQKIDGVDCDVAGHSEEVTALALKGWKVVDISACERNGTPGVYVLMQKDP